MKSLCYSIILLLLVFVSRNHGVRVCPSWPDYLNPKSEKCFDNPDGEPSNVTQILQRWGCDVEECQLVTEDGYYILVFRATLGTVRKPTPIVMGHGLFMNSLGFVAMSNKSAAYQLLEQGYQVFLINFRGTRYSTGHKTLSQEDEAYWNFSFHQMAQFDIPVVMDLVAKKTKGSKAVYIGFSMGTTVINIYSILYPVESKQNLKGIIELAPVANLTNIRSVAGKVASLWPVLKPLTNSIWHGRLLPRSYKRSEMCSKDLIGILLCPTVAGFILGPNFKMMDPLTEPVIFQHVPDVMCAMVIEHYYQILMSNQFQLYDYGSEGNMEKYGNPSPPIYDFSKISVPITVYVGLNDYAAEAQNAVQLYNNIPRNARCGFHTMPDLQWTHLSFIMSKDLPISLNEDMLNTISIMESNSCGSISSEDAVLKAVGETTA